MNRFDTFSALNYRILSVIRSLHFPKIFYKLADTYMAYKANWISFSVKNQSKAPEYTYSVSGA